MIRLNDCKELNYFDHCEILEHIDNIKYNKVIKHLKELNINSLEINNTNGNKVILHNSPKNKDNIQISKFMILKGELIAIGDTQINLKTMKNVEYLKETLINNYFKIMN